MVKMICLAINGRAVSVPEGTLIVNAAKQAGIDIPTFCYHPKMEPVAMCRQCLVEIGRPVIDRTTGQPVLDETGKPKIQFGPKLETSCSTPVSEGMLVLTTSDRARMAQKEILEFLLTSHPLDCPVCDKGGECPLQNLTLAYGPGKSRFIFDEKHHAEKHIPLGDLIWLDRERCIQCARCIRFQKNIAGEPVLSFYQRGRNTDIITASEPPFDSIFSGNTSDICPVGALTTVDFRFGARPWEMKAAASICTHCAVGCNLTLNTRRESASGGSVVVKRIMPRQNEAINEIWLCDKGRFAHHFTEKQERLGKPQVRKNGKLEVVKWDEALELAAATLQAGRKDTIFLAGGRLSNEDLYNLKRFSYALGGEAVLYTQMGGGALTAQYGLGRSAQMPGGLNFGDMGANTTILVVACDLYNEAPLWYLRTKQAVERGSTLIVVNARETKLERYSNFAVRYSYGDEEQTISGLTGKNKIGKHISGVENLVILFGSDGIGLDGSSRLAVMCASLLQETNHGGKPGSGLIGVWPKVNDQGAWELGYQPSSDLAGLLKGKTVYVAAADPAGDDPMLAAALKTARAVIVQELYLTETARMADIVLPAQAFTEREGSYTSGERRVQRFYPAVLAHGSARADFTITAQIGSVLGVELESHSAALIMDRIAAAFKTFEGISYQTLAEVHKQWPSVGRGDLYFGGSTYQNEQGLGVQLTLTDLPDNLQPLKKWESLRPDEDRWLVVPVTLLYDLGITVSTSELLHARTGEPFLFLNPGTAGKLGLGSGAQVQINGYPAKVALDAAVPASVVLVPRSMGIPIHAPAVADLKKA